MSNYSEITSRIFIGTSSGAENKTFFKRNKIKAVLNCTTDIKNYFCDDNVEYARIPIEDSLLAKDINLFYRYLPFIAEFIHKHADIEKHNIFIHCWAGQQRSTAALVAYMMKYKHRSIAYSKKFIMSRRPEAFHHGNHINFEKALAKYEKDL